MKGVGKVNLWFLGFVVIQLSWGLKSKFNSSWCKQNLELWSKWRFSIISILQNSNSSFCISTKSWIIIWTKSELYCIILIVVVHEKFTLKEKVQLFLRQLLRNRLWNVRMTQLVFKASTMLKWKLNK